MCVTKQHLITGYRTLLPERAIKETAFKCTGGETVTYLVPETAKWQAQIIWPVEIGQ